MTPLKQAADLIRQEISRLEGILRQIESSEPAIGRRSVGAPASNRRQMSEEARKRIAEAQARRWANHKAQTEPAPAQAEAPKQEEPAAVPTEGDGSGTRRKPRRAKK